MDPTFSAYASRSVPRYTSYPTAPHFSGSVGPRDYTRWLAGLPPSEPVSLYLHVPFCRQICWYCGCNMKLASRDATIEAYAGSLMQEVRLAARALPSRMTLSHLHWGGGTPTALSPDTLMRAMELIDDVFDIVPGAELAIESDPRTLSVDMINRIGCLGFTRASFGVQEFDLRVQQAINRIQPPQMVRAAVDGLRDAGVAGINFDLIYGLPHQTVDTLLNTVRLCAGMRPDRIALFGYAHVPWMAKRQRMIDEKTLPDARARVDQAQAASDAILDAGYVAIGLDHFALPGDPLALAADRGTLRRNFQGYTTDSASTLLGLGATSIGRTSEGYVQNITETGAWARAVQDGILPVGKGFALTQDDRMRAAVIERLMCQGQVNLADVADMHGVSRNWYEMVDDQLWKMASDGLILRSGPDIKVQEKARPLVRVVASVFDAYLRSGPARHSVAV
ncbi:MAG: oxygen-independent coproporphyrinogen III oxidase [Pseudomonadota bacterium]